MLDNIVLGFKDIFHHIKLFLLIIISILIVTIIFVSSTLSMFYSNGIDEKNYLINSYELIPISTDMSKNDILLQKYYDFIRKNGMSYFISENLTDYFQMQTLVIVGNTELFNTNISKEKETTFYFNNTSLNENIISIHDKNYKAQSVKLNNTDFPDPVEYLNEDESPTLLVVLAANENILDWLNYEDGGKIMEFVQNSIFDQPVETYNHTLSKIFYNSYLNLHYIEKTNSEQKFVLTYIYPYMVITIFCIIISFYIIYDYFLRKMYREYILHILYGAQIKDIILRNSVIMIAALIVLCSSFTFIKQGEDSILVNLGYLIIILLLILFEIITIVKINNKKKLESIKGEK